MLVIYHRIVHPMKLEYNQFVYDFWLLDIPKMVDLAMVYCVYNGDGNKDDEKYTNIEIVRDIVAGAITTNADNYARDFDDFINTLYQDKLPMIHRDLQLVINLTPEAMHLARKNFADPLRSFLITANKIIF